MKPTILIFSRYYLPGYRSGGPIRSIANMAELLGIEFDFRIVTLDHDKGCAESYPGMQSDDWNELDHANVYYARERSCSLAGIARLMAKTPHDLLYVNSFFDPIFTIRPILAQKLGLSPTKPLVIAPRGEFSRGALKLKRWKKELYLGIARSFRLYENVTWQASTNLEASDILRQVTSRGLGRPAVKVVVAPDLTSQHAIPRINPDIYSKLSRNSLKVCFLSRISPMKNLDFALRTLGKVRARISFSIYGPLEAGSYWKECKRLIATLPQNISVTYNGCVEPDAVVETIGKHDLFFLPTRGENFGHVIHEALAAGVPVLISDQTPWVDLEEKGVGWALPLSSTSGFAKVIENVANWNIDAAYEASKRARAFAAQIGLDKRALEANRSLLKIALDCARSQT